MYNYTIPNATVRDATQYASYGGYGLTPPRTGGPDSLFGADPAAAPGALDQLKAFAEQSTMGVKNKYIAAGALALGIGYYGYTKGWF